MGGSGRGLCEKRSRAALWQTLQPMDPLWDKTEPIREFCGASLEMYLNKSRKYWGSGRESQRNNRGNAEVRAVGGDASGWGRYPWRGCSPCGCEDPHQSRGRVRGRSSTNCAAEGPKRNPRKFQMPLDAFQCAPELIIDRLCTGVLESDRGQFKVATLTPLELQGNMIRTGLLTKKYITGEPGL